jgi:hypothetical protein
MGSKVLAIYDTASERVSRVFGPKDFEQGGDLRLNVFVGTNGDMVVLFGVSQPQPNASFCSIHNKYEAFGESDRISCKQLRLLVAFGKLDCPMPSGK